MKLNLGCGPHYADGWVNVDRVYDTTHNVTPDVVNPTGRPCLLEVEDVTQIYLGHVLEHVAWADVPGFLSECLDLLNPGGQCLVVGPDVWNTLTMWREGKVPDSLVSAVLENDDTFMVDGAWWDGSRHQWNADQNRVAYQMRQAGFVDVMEYRSVCAVPSGWPIVSRVEWQSAVSGVAP